MGPDVRTAIPSNSGISSDEQATEFVAGAELWARIRELGRTARAPKRIATAYIGEGAAQKIGLDQGDRLLVALSEANVKNGTVNPYELRKLKALGVQVSCDPNLHAKIYHFGNVAVVGSANLSNSSETLHEAALITRDEKQLHLIEEWFDRSSTTAVTDAQLDRLEPLFVRRTRGTASRGDHQEARVWLVGIGLTDFPESEEEEYREAAKRAAKKIAEPSRHVESLRFTKGSKFYREVKVDDLLIQVFKMGRRLEVFPHAVVLDTHRVPQSGALYVHVEELTAPALTWKQFRKETLQTGLKLGNDVGTRLLKKQSQIDLAKKLTRVTAR